MESDNNVVEMQLLTGKKIVESVVELIIKENLEEVSFRMTTNLVDYPFEIVVRRGKQDAE